MKITAEVSQRVYSCYKTHRKQMKNSLCKRRGGQIVTAAEQRQRARAHVLDIMKDDLFEAEGIMLDHRVIKDIVNEHEAARAAARHAL